MVILFIAFCLFIKYTGLLQPVLQQIHNLDTLRLKLVLIIGILFVVYPVYDMYVGGNTATSMIIGHKAYTVADMENSVYKVSLYLAETLSGEEDHTDWFETLSENLTDHNTLMDTYYAEACVAAKQGNPNIVKLIQRCNEIENILTFYRSIILVGNMILAGLLFIVCLYLLPVEPYVRLKSMTYKGGELY